MITKEKLVELFPNWEQGLYEEVLEHSTFKTAVAGTILLKKGQNIKSAMLVTEGTVKLYQ